MSNERDKGVRQIGYALGGDAAGLYGFYVAASATEAAGVSLLGGLVEIEAGTALAEAIIGVGFFTGGLALAFLPVVVTAAAIAVLSSNDSAVAGLGQAVEGASTLVSPTGLALSPYSLFSTGSLEFAHNVAAYGDVILGGFTAGSVQEAAAAGVGFVFGTLNPDNPLFPSSPSNSASQHPNPTPGPTPGPAPSPAPSPGSFTTPASQTYPGGGIDPDLYPWAPGDGDTGFDSSNPDLGSSGVTGIFNGGGITVITNLPSPPDPPMAPDPPDPVDPAVPTPTPTPPSPGPHPIAPPSDDDDDDDDDYY